jgi:tRNA U34 5-methylaminomethyl-2-thiouridine-forming methyltransferase MnmC
MQSDYEVVRLGNGTYSIRSRAEDETFHPVIGPVREARALYVNQLRLPSRVAAHQGEFVIWDVGLGAAANVLTAFEATRDIACSIRVVSFDRTIGPLEFALRHGTALEYIDRYASQVKNLLEHSHVEFSEAAQRIRWELRLGDFPTLIAQSGLENSLPAPHAILFDAYSPAKNPAMWTAPLFAGIHRMLDPERPCAMPTYSRSTMLRVTLLLAGFYVGVGHATGAKEETTIAANTLELLEEPLPQEWLQRARHSTSAEPMWEPVYRQSPISELSWNKLIKHPQFNF